MDLITDKDKLRTMIKTDSIRGRVLNLLLSNGPQTSTQMSEVLELPPKRIASNLASIEKEASYIEIKVTKNKERQNVYELIGLYKSMSKARARREKREHPIGMRERTYQSVFAEMNKLQVTP